MANNTANEDNHRHNIKFGTDGWRAIINKDFTFENVEIVTKAIAKYILEKDGIEKPVLIGYDPRNMADKFAEFSAEILKNAGFKVMLSSEIVPTPVLAYNAKFYDADALMFTASHNPPEYLGIKFIPDYAGPATTEITSNPCSAMNHSTSSSKNVPDTNRTRQIPIIHSNVLSLRIMSLLNFHNKKRKAPISRSLIWCG